VANFSGNTGWLAPHLLSANSRLISARYFKKRDEIDAEMDDDLQILYDKFIREYKDIGGG